MSTNRLVKRLAFFACLSWACFTVFCAPVFGQFVPIGDPDTIFGDYPQYINAIEPEDYDRYSESALVNTVGGDLSVRAWRYSAAAGGIVESNNVLASDKTALIVVHPWGIEDGQGWDFPYLIEGSEGYAFLGTHADNVEYKPSTVVFPGYLHHVDNVVKGFVDSTRGQVPLVVYGMPGTNDAIRQKLYRDYTHQTTASDRATGQAEIEDYLGALPYNQLPDKIPVVKNLQYAPGDVVAYDDLGYAELKSYLQSYGIENILLAGYGADPDLVTSLNSSLASSTSGYLNLKDDFNVFVVGDATMASWKNTASQPSQFTRVSTRNAILEATIEEGVAATQISWIEQLSHDSAGGPSWRGAERTCLAEWTNWQKMTDSTAPSRYLYREADHWESNLDPEEYGNDHFADEFEAGKAELLDHYYDDEIEYGDRVNVIKIYDNEELVFHLPDPVENPERGRLRVQISWNRGSAGQEPIWTLDLHSGSGSDEQLELTSRDVAGDGWLTDVYETTLGTDITSTIVHLGFDGVWAYVDDLIIDLQMGDQNFMDEDEATMMAANWGMQGEAWMPGDFNGDGWVNGLDADILAANWLQVYSPTAAAAVPEPSLLALVLAALCFFGFLSGGRVLGQVTDLQNTYSDYSGSKPAIRGTLSKGGTLAGGSEGITLDQTAGFDVGGSSITIEDGRFLRENRREGDFVGADSGDQNGFVGVQDAGGSGPVRSATAGLRIKQSRDANVDARSATEQRSAIYDPRLSVGFTVNRRPPTEVGADLRRRLLGIANLKLSGRLEVTVRGDTAVVSGRAESSRDRELAALVLMFEPGIAKVENRLTVAGNKR